MDFLNTMTTAAKQNPGLNYFSYSPQLRSLLGTLGTRASSIAQQPLGMSASERTASINQMTEKIRAGEKPDMEAMRVRMARQGLLGSGIEEQNTEAIRRGTNENVAGAVRDVNISDAQRRAAEAVAGLSAATGAGNLITGGEQGAEVANANRRAEGRASLQDMMTYLQMLYGAQYQSIQPYAQAILAQGGQTSGPDLSSLAWLPYLYGK